MAGSYAHPEVLVDTAWVYEHLSDPQVRLLEVDVDTSAYDAGHIPGAVGLHWKRDLETPVARDIASPEQIEGLLSVAGITPASTVILFGDNNNWFATYAWWLLKYYGHADARIMNGGRKKWMDEGRPMTKDVPAPKPTAYKTKAPDPSIRAVRDEVLAAGRAKSAALVDVRSPQGVLGRAAGARGAAAGRRAARRARARRRQHSLGRKRPGGRHLQARRPAPGAV